jgi:hypothetical protein
MVEHLLPRPRRPVRALVRQGVVDIDQRDDAGLDRNRLARQPVRIAAAVPALVVMAGDRARYTTSHPIGQDTGADDRGPS